MRIEGEDDGRPAQLARLDQQPLDETSMAPMYAVEIADRQRTAAELVRQVIEGSKQSHDSLPDKLPMTHDQAPVTKQIRISNAQMILVFGHSDLLLVGDLVLDSWCFKVSAIRSKTSSHWPTLVWRNSRIVGYHGESSRPVIHRQSGA